MGTRGRGGTWGQPFRFWGLGHGDLGFVGGLVGQPFLEV